MFIAKGIEIMETASPECSINSEPLCGSRGGQRMGRIFGKSARCYNLFDMGIVSEEMEVQLLL